MVRRSLSSLLLFAAFAHAQTQLVLPASHAAREGSTGTNVPFGRSTPVRVQCAYDPLLFAGPCTITAIALRLDGNATAASKQVDCELRLSTMAVGLVDIRADFATNRGADETVVLPRQTLILAGQSSPALPSPFLPAIPLAVPFAFDPARGALLLEVVVFGQPPGAYTLDATWICDSPESAFGPPACAPAAGLPLRVETATTQVLWGRPWVVRALDAPPGALVSLVLGTMESGTWNGLLLPYDLASLGAPGCFIATDLSTSFFQTAMGDGSATFTFAIPNVPWATGTWLRYQAGAVVGGANLLGVVTSQAKKVQVCGPEPVARVWATDLTATAGVRELGVAPVVRLTLQ
jgi:hypothetical protein